MEELKDLSPEYIKGFNQNYKLHGKYYQLKRMMTVLKTCMPVQDNMNWNASNRYHEKLLINREIFVSIY